MRGGGAVRGAAGGAEELDEVAVLDWREDEPLDVPELAIMGMVSKSRPLPAPPPVWPPDDSSCLGRRQRQQHTATAEPTRMKATNTDPTMRNGTYIGTARREERDTLLKPNSHQTCFCAKILTYRLNLTLEKAAQHSCLSAQACEGRSGQTVTQKTE